MVSLAQYEALQGRYDKLVDYIVTLKREGFAAPDARTTVAAPAAELPKAVRAAIADLSEPGSAAYRHLVTQAWEMMGQEVGEEDIIKRISAGEPIDL